MEVVLTGWRSATGWKVGRFVLMPDHIHLFTTPDDQNPPSLSRWVTYWKSLVSKGWPWAGEQPIWQQDFWDRQLRSHESYSVKWDYVRNNPVRHGLVGKAEDWPYQGELNPLDW